MDQDKILIGRDRSCFIVLEGTTISRQHAELSRAGTSFFLKDLRSDNQTFLNDVPLPAEEKTLLKPNDLIRIGDHELRFTLPQPGEDSDIYEATDSDILEVKMVKKLLKALDRDNAPSLEIIEGPALGQRFVLEGKSQEILIGRDPACEFQIDSDVISRKHARVIRKWDAVQIEDLGSRNGVYVGPERIRQKVLKDGDRIHLGTIVLAFRNPQELALDLAQKTKEPTPEVKAKPSLSPEKKPDLPEGRSTRPPPSSHHLFSPSDLLMALLGLAVLIGAIWGILKML